jgi:drug/metabolite transporter (DMT)-like permease
MVVAAALMWSTSSLFMRALQQPTFLHVEQPALTSLQIAFYRSLFAGLCLLLIVRKRLINFRPLMVGMVLAFGIMTALYLSALGGGPAANAILLQNTAPAWVYFLGVHFFRDPRDRRTLLAVLIALAGALVIVAGNWPRNLTEAEQGRQSRILIMAAGSGLFYALVVLLLRQLRDESPAWLTTLNLLGSAVVIAGFAFCDCESFGEFQAWLAMPTPGQYAFIAAYGVIQLAVPYVLFSRGLKVVSPQEAGIITLLEPVFNPLWAYLIAPDRESPTIWTLAGGSLILAALAWRYWPHSADKAAPQPA